jgi:hypothetical protein
MSSVECLQPSYQHATPPRPARGECGCCHAVRDIEGEHPLLGQLCVWCSRAFDYSVGEHGERPTVASSCPRCHEAVACPDHEDR